MKQVLVRYKVKPERVKENEELVRAVYEPPRAARHRARGPPPTGEADPDLVVVAAGARPRMAAIEAGRGRRSRPPGTSTCGPSSWTTRVTASSTLR